jgi:hypothetical protein
MFSTYIQFHHYNPSIKMSCYVFFHEFLCFHVVWVLNVGMIYHLCMTTPLEKFSRLVYGKHYHWMKIWFNITFKSQNIMCQPYGTMIGLDVCDKLCKILMYRDYTKCIY